MSVNKEVIAVDEYIRRRDRLSHPDGTFDKQGRFYLSEVCDCCKWISSSSWGYPYSQLIHRRTLKHVCTLMGADIKLARKELRRR
jgi:hypothetical protein